MVVHVARKTRGSVREIALQPYALTLWTWGHLMQAARIERTIERGGELNSAALHAVAFHEPRKLAELSRAYEDEVGLTPTAEEAIEGAQPIINMMHQLDRLEGRL